MTGIGAEIALIRLWRAWIAQQVGDDPTSIDDLDRFLAWARAVIVAEHEWAIP